jgi:signal transduction histidine kinase
MSLEGQAIEIDTVSLREVVEDLRQTRIFAETAPEDFIQALGSGTQVDRVRAKSDAVLVAPGDPKRFYWVVIEGETRAERKEPDGSSTPVGVAGAGEGFGETPLLSAKAHPALFIVAAQDSVLLRFTEEEFWKLFACCPAARKVILAYMAQRVYSYQVEALHREKLVSLGTLAAGLMHELHNPGSAAKRAASQLRGNLLRLQEVSLRSSAKAKTPAQLDCMHDLLAHAVKGCHAPALSTLEQLDAEEAMSEWLQGAGVENAFTIGPALVEIGFDREQLACAQAEFEAGSFSDALNWLEALVSSVSLVCAIEESIARISELVMAVKKFAYDERSPAKELDVHDSLQSTLTILGHKLRLKQITVEKRFSAAPSTIHTRGSALSQVWTNLIDNAVDASPQNAQIEIATWTENAKETGTEPEWLVVSVLDHGSGIPPEALARIFEPFFTTKPQGSGTGLGLEIVQRIVTQKFGGTIDVKSEPGNTQFVVRLPLNSKAKGESPAKAR